MDIRVLKYFVAVAKVGNISRAAESLHIAQPSLSKQLIELENELGKQLLVRGKRKVTLTDSGTLLLKRAEEILALFDKAQQEVRCDEGTIGGRVSIGGIATYAVLSATAALRKDHPQVTFDFYSGDANDVTQRLDHGSLDFAVLLEPVDALKYEYVLLWQIIPAGGCLCPKPVTSPKKNA